MNRHTFDPSVESLIEHHRIHNPAAARLLVIVLDSTNELELLVGKDIDFWDDEQHVMRQRVSIHKYWIQSRVIHGLLLPRSGIRIE